MTNDFPVRELAGFKRSIALALGLMSVLAMRPTQAEAADTPPQIEILETRSAGSGCPDGTASASLAPDGSAISVLYDQLSAQVGGPEAAPGERVSKGAKCAVRLKFKVPRGWTLGVSKVENRGFIHLPEGMKALFWSRVKNDRYSPVGPVYGYEYWGEEVSEDFTIEAEAQKKLAIPSCRTNDDEVATIRLDNQLWIWGKASAEEGMIVADSTDGVIKQHYRLKLQRCKPQSIKDLLIRWLRGLR